MRSMLRCPKCNGLDFSMALVNPVRVPVDIHGKIITSKVERRKWMEFVAEAFLNDGDAKDSIRCEKEWCGWESRLCHTCGKPYYLDHENYQSNCSYKCAVKMYGNETIRKVSQ